MSEILSNEVNNTVSHLVLDNLLQAITSQGNIQSQKCRCTRQIIKVHDRLIPLNSLILSNPQKYGNPYPYFRHLANDHQSVESQIQSSSFQKFIHQEKIFDQLGYRVFITEYSQTKTSVFRPFSITVLSLLKSYSKSPSTNFHRFSITFITA